MNQLIAISASIVGTEQAQTVNARDLHAFLEVGKDFSTWIKDRISQYGFAEGEDYVSTLLPNFGEKGQGRPTKEYHLTLDMAKELAMVERNDKGKQARQYFIECERKAAKPPAIPQTLPEALRLAAEAIEQRDKLAIENQAKTEALAEAAPKIAALDRFSNHQGEHNLRSATKLLGLPEHKLKTWLLMHSWYYRDRGGRLCAHSDKIKTGHLDAIPVEVPRSDGIQVVAQPVITQKGLAKLAELLAKSGLLGDQQKAA